MAQRMEVKMEKIKVAIICGGRSGEHEVSLQSAKSVISAINRKKYDITLIGIDKKGKWFLLDERDFLENPEDPKRIALKTDAPEVFISPAPNSAQFFADGKKIRVDVVFPVLHGTYGEDGTIQGLFDMMDVAYVGAGTLSSAVIMDKEVTKRLFKEGGIPIVDYIALEKTNHQFVDAESLIEKRLKYPVFIKPANLGSSIGTNKVEKRSELKAALEDAWQYDTKILAEQGVDAREIECALLGNEDVIASELGEIIPHHPFYSYEAKYIDPNGAELIIGANLEPDIKKEIQETAKKAYKVLNCEGMARADFFLEKGTNRIYLNELNTIPGFTKISMYPKLFEASGIKYPELIDRLITLGIERYHRRRKLKTEYSI